MSNTNQSRKYYYKEIIVFSNLPKKHKLYKINDYSINENTILLFLLLRPDMFLQ